MSACECCWWSKSLFQDPSEAYHRALKEHQDSGCVCTKDTLEGRKARAGQWWDETLQRDSRSAPEPGEETP